MPMDKSMKAKHKLILYVAVGLLVLFLFYKLLGGFAWFLIQTIFYAALIMLLLIFLRKKGFFK